MKIIFLLFNIFSSLSWGGSDRVGNGGDYVMCRNNYFRLYFYDYYELSRIRKLQAVIPSVKNPFQAAKEIIERQSDRDVVFKNRLLSYLSDLKANAEYSVYNLAPVNDNPGIVLERSCKLMQAAISYPYAGQWHYVIYDKAWGYMDTKNKTALVLHEIIYRLAYECGYNDSSAAIAINQFMMVSGKDLGTDPDAFWNLRMKWTLILPEESVR